MFKIFALAGIVAVVVWYESAKPNEVAAAEPPMPEPPMPKPPTLRNNVPPQDIALSPQPVAIRMLPTVPPPVVVASPLPLVVPAENTPPIRNPDTLPGAWPGLAASSPANPAPLPVVTKPSIPTPPTTVSNPTAQGPIAKAFRELASEIFIQA